MADDIDIANDNRTINNNQNINVVEQLKIAGAVSALKEVEIKISIENSLYYLCPRRSKLENFEKPQQRFGHKSARSLMTNTLSGIFPNSYPVSMCGVNAIKWRSAMQFRSQFLKV